MTAEPDQTKISLALALACAQKALEPIGAQHEARLLVQHVLRCDAARLLLRMGDPLHEEQARQLDKLLTQRLSGRPLQLIFGEWGFMGLTFFVEEGVLIPRADTETLAEEALKKAREKGARTALDLCCGSGCIAVALAKLGNLRVTASDLSGEALRLTKRNAERNEVAQSVYAMRSDLFSSIEGTFDLIVSNPPYIPTGEIDSLMREVREHEPRMALDGGADGLDFYRAIAAHAGKHLNANGALLLECGIGQAGNVSNLLRDHGFGAIQSVRDLCGIERVVCAERT